MNTLSIHKLYHQLPKTKQIIDCLSKSNKIQITGLIGSSISFVLEAVFSNSNKSIVFFCNDKEEAAYL